MLTPRTLTRMALLSVALAALTLLLGLWFGSRAQPIQLIRPDTSAAASLFGDEQDSGGVPGTPLGRPQWLILEAPAAVLPGQGENGVRYVSEPKLRELGVYPLQLKTVVFFRNALALGFLGLAALLGLLLLWRRRALRHFPPSSVTSSDLS